MRLPNRSPIRRPPRPTAVTAVLALAGTLTACTEPPPRSFQELMDDRIAREAVLARCDFEAEERNDIECANARRAAATIALREERARREALELESRRKIEALRAQMDRREREAREAAEATARAYDEQWENGAPGSITTPGADAAVTAGSVSPEAVYVPAAGEGTTASDAPAEGAGTTADASEMLQEIPLPTRRRIELDD